MSSVKKVTSSNNICKSLGMSTRMEFWTYLVYHSMHWFVLLYLCWLTATDTDRAIGKYLIDRTPFLKDEKRQFL